MGISHHLNLPVSQRGVIQKLFIATGPTVPFFSQCYSNFVLNFCQIPQALRIGIAATYQVELTQGEIIPLGSALQQSLKEEIQSVIFTALLKACDT